MIYIYIYIYIWAIVCLRYLDLSGGMVRPWSATSLSVVVDVIFDKYARIQVVPDHGRDFKAKVTIDFSFLEGATKDIDMIVDAAVVYVQQEAPIKYTVKKTGLNSC